MYPTSEPLFTHLLATEWANAPDKPTAMDTPLRYSGAYGCLRQMGYKAFSATPTEPLTPAGAWQMGIGTTVHEEVQAAILRAYPQAKFEVASRLGKFISGSCDADVSGTSIGRVLFELKTMGSYGFESAMGYKRGYGKLSLKDPMGPKWGAIVQAGMNALGIEAMERESGFEGEQFEFLVLGSLAFEIISEKMNRQVQISDFARIGGEWHIPRHVWEPAAMAEFERLDEAGEAIDQGYLPDRWARDDGGNDTKLDPFGENWQCDYCRFRTLCVNDGDGQVNIMDSKATGVSIRTKVLVGEGEAL